LNKNKLHWFYWDGESFYFLGVRSLLTGNLTSVTPKQRAPGG